MLRPPADLVAFFVVQEHQLPGALHALQSPLDHYGLLAVGVLVLLEDFGVPVPGETILILAAVYAGTGRLNVWLVGIVAICAAIVGDNIGFAIGHFGGRPLVERFGTYIFLTPERFDTATRWFQRHGGKVIVIARFVEGLRQANGIVAGTSGMHWAKFVFFNAIGATLWVALWVCVGYFSGNHIDTIYDAATRYVQWFGIAIALIIIALIVRYILRRRARGPAVPEQSGGGAGPGPVDAD